MRALVHIGLHYFILHASRLLSCGNYDEGLRFHPKLDYLEFDGRIDADEFLYWLNMVDRVFEYYEPSECKKVKLVAIKMCKNASIW